MAERTVLEWIRKSLEDKLFPPKPQGHEGEKIHAALNMKVMKQTYEKITGRPIEEPKKEKEGD